MEDFTEPARCATCGGRAEDLAHRINQLNALKAAQRPGSSAEEQFQQQIDQLTNQLYGWETAAPRFQQIDQLIADARHVVDQTHEIHRAATRRTLAAGRSWSSLGNVTAVLAVLILLIGLLFTIPTAAWVLMVSLGLTAVGSLLLGVRARREADWAEDDALARWEEATERLEEIQAQRSALTNSLTPGAAPDAGPVEPVQAEAERMDLSPDAKAAYDQEMDAIARTFGTAVYGP